MKNHDLTQHSLFPFCVLITIYVSAITICVVQGIKIIDLWGLIIPGGYFAASFTYVCTDITSEIYGKQFARKIMYCGFIAMAVVFGLVSFDMALPADSNWEYEQSYNDVFGLGLQLITAGFLCFLVAQHIDIYLFEYLRKITKGKHLWFRNNGSTIISKLFDCTIYNFVGFWGHYEPPVILQLTISAYIFYMILALLDTPLVYAGVWIIKRFNPRTSLVQEQNLQG